MPHCASWCYLHEGCLSCVIEHGGRLIHLSVFAAVPIPHTLTVERVRRDARGLQTLYRCELLRRAQWLVVFVEDPSHIIGLIGLAIIVCTALVEVRSRVSAAFIEVAGFRVLLILGEGAVRVHSWCIRVVFD